MRVKSPEYQRAHRALRKERGRAGEHSCVDCSGQASEWSYDGITGFSWDFRRYDPRCRPCHLAYDGLNEVGYPRRRALLG